MAHYDLEEVPIPRMYEASGHNLMILEDYAQIVIGEFPSFWSLTFNYYMQLFRNYCLIPHNASH